MGEALAMLLSGGATGIFGTMVGGVLSYLKTKQDNEHALLMREYDMKELDLEIKTAEKMTAMNLEAKALEGSYQDAQTFVTASMELTNGQKWLVTIVDFLRGLMRPLITIFFMFMSYLLFNEGTLISDIEHAIIYLTVSCITWWFGDRQIAKYLLKK